MKDATLPVGTNLAICATYRDVVRGRGFMASVEMRGRILAVVEGENDVWLYGVNPSGLSESGCTIVEAHAKFRQSFRAMLYDIAAEAETFLSFHCAVKDVMQNSQTLEASWKEAIKQLSQPTIDTLGLPVIPSETHPPALDVVEIQATNSSSPAENKLDDAQVVVPQKKKAA